MNGNSNDDGDDDGDGAHHDHFEFRQSLTRSNFIVKSFLRSHVSKERSVCMQVTTVLRLVFAYLSVWVWGRSYSLSIGQHRPFTDIRLASQPIDRLTDRPTDPWGHRIGACIDRSCLSSAFGLLIFTSNYDESRSCHQLRVMHIAYLFVWPLMAIRTNFQFNMEQHWYAFAYEFFFRVFHKPVFEDYVEVTRSEREREGERNARKNLAIWRHDQFAFLQRRRNINDNINNNNKLSMKTKPNKSEMKR